MPKKFTGENSKATAARARKEANKQESNQKAAKAKEDAIWMEDDKNVLKKLQRKEDAERKKQDALAKKQEKARLYEDEMTSASPKAAPIQTKVTRAVIDARNREEQRQREQEAAQKRLEAQKLVVQNEDLCENVNRLTFEGESAHTVSEAISVLGDNKAVVDKHPEKRMKNAYADFEERRLAELKIEKPTLRLSQLKQLIKKEWQKSPDNPLNENIMSIINTDYTDTLSYFNYFINRMVRVLYKGAVKEVADSYTVLEILNFVVGEVEAKNSAIFFGGSEVPPTTVAKDINGWTEPLSLIVRTKKGFEPVPEFPTTPRIAQLVGILQMIHASDKLAIANFVEDPNFKAKLLQDNPALRADPEIVDFLADYYLLNWMFKAVRPYVTQHPQLTVCLYYIMEKSLPSALLRSLLENPLPPIAYSRPNVRTPEPMPYDPFANTRITRGPPPSSLSSATQPSSSSQRPVVTLDMFANALAAIPQGSQGNTSQAAVSMEVDSAAIPNASQITDNLVTLYANQLAQLGEFGFTDQEENIRALQATNGDVDKALELILSAREAMEE